MKIGNLIRQHVAALRALLVFTVILGFGYPLLIWLIALIPGLHAKAEGSILNVGGRAVGSALIGQAFTDSSGNTLPQYFQSRPSAAGSAGYDPTSSGGSSLGPESIIDVPTGVASTDPTFKPSLLTQVCSRSAAVAATENLGNEAGARPFCTGGGVGAVLSVLGPRDTSGAKGRVVHPTAVVSINEPCATTKEPFLAFYEGVRVQCAMSGQDYSSGQLVPIRGAAPSDPAVPADAVTASGSGLDPNISPAYAAIQIPRVAKARHTGVEQIRQVVERHQSGRALAIFGEPTVNVLQLNLELDRDYPLTG